MLVDIHNVYVPAVTGSNSDATVLLATAGTLRSGQA